MSKLLTVAEVAERLRVHPMTVRRHIKSGRIRSTRVGRSVRVPEDAIGQAEARRFRDMTAEELRAWVLRPRTQEELAKRRLLFDEATKRRDAAGPIDIPSDVLVRVGRRWQQEVYGDKTLEEIIAEESEPLGD